MTSVRTREPFRGQGVMRFEIPEDTLPPDRRARLLWRVVETLDLAAFTAGAKALEGHAGRSQVLVRGLQKVSCAAMLAAIGANSLQHAPPLLA